jgi:hypothetical protein
MTNQHPITPPPELVHQWTDMLSHRSDHDVFSLAAQWGADQELEACCELLEVHGYKGTAIDLRAARRTTPPTLKKQALEALERMHDTCLMTWDNDTIRRALEALPND